MKLSKILSYLFHPINFPIIGAFLYFLFLPRYIFESQEHTILITIFIGTYIFPLLLIFLLKKFGMIHSYHMVSIEERKFPTLLFISICLFLGNWLFKTTIVNLLSLFFIGYGLFLIFSYLLFYFQLKISLHTGAFGGLIGFLIYFSYHYKVNLIMALMVLFVLSGVIASARLRLSAHKVSELIIGFILGLLSQILVYYIYSI